MKTKHTPGPWELTSIPFRVAANRRDQVSRFIADCNENHGDSEENEANARLIAAAPDLLEALQSLISTQNLSALDKGIGTATKSGMAWLAARAAIAKATEGQP